MKYPDIKSSNFYDKIFKIYNEFKIKRHKLTEKEICNPKEYKLQNPQKFVSKYLSPDTPYKNLLIFHGIGSGKTCTAIRIGEEWKRKRKIIFVAPASLTGNFRNELRTLCADNEYITEKERKILHLLEPTSDEYKRIIARSDKKIDIHYEIYSNNKFIDKIKAKKIDFKNKVLIIDEIQNLISEVGTFYKIIYKALKNASSNLIIALLSATPIANAPNEAAKLFNLFRLKKELPTGTEFNNMFIDIQKDKRGNITFNAKNLDLFKEYIRGYVSYFKGAPKIAYPKSKIKYVDCEMSSFQYKQYKKVLNEAKKLKNVSQEFHLGLRMVSNIAFPNGKFKKTGFCSLTKESIKDLKQYSCKFYRAIKEIRQTEGLVFVYSDFREYGGLKSFIKVLELKGYKNYEKYDIGEKRFAVWDGNTKYETKEDIRNIYNNFDNKNGSMIKIILCSKSCSEGISFKRVQKMILLATHWHQKRMDQIIGRGIRYCSHKDVKKKKVDVVILMATYKEKKTVDYIMKNIMDEKEKLISQFEIAIRESAIDCNLNKNSNDDIKIKCDK